jgi:putative transposase
VFFKLRTEIKKRYFWAGKLWTQRYFVETIGNANEEVIRAYVQNQLNVMNKQEDSARQLGLF